MKPTFLTSILILLTTAAAGAAQPPKPETVVFANVHVVPMDRERVVENQTVIVRDGKIAAIAPADKAAVPAGAKVIDGRGKFLMPGLVEMHGHLPHPKQGETLERAFLTLFVANGVTTVRGMFGFPNHPALRDRIDRGELFGPKLVVAGPALSGQSVLSAAAGAQLVRDFKKAGFDWLKVHEGLSVDAFDAIAAAAKKEGIPFGGHIADDVGLLHALKGGQYTVEHLDGYLEALEADDSPLKKADPQTRAQKLGLHADERKIAAVVAATKQAGAWNAPTMALWATLKGPETAEELNRRPELKYVPKGMREQWAQARPKQLAFFDRTAAKRELELRNKVLKALSDAGAGILLASDAPQLYSVPGFSLHREMRAMADAGLTPYQVLAAGTRHAAECLKQADQFGTVAVGQRADLILVDDNPLKDVAHVAKRAGVMLRGVWLSEEELKKKLDEIEAKVQG